MSRVLNDFMVAVYEDYTEFRHADQGIYVDSAFVKTGTFSTHIEGGYKQGSFPIMMEHNRVRDWFKKYLSYFVVLFSPFGDPVFEGRLERSKIIPGGVTIDVLGLFVHAGDVLTGLAYPTTTPTSISDIIEDVVSLSDLWQDNYTYITTTTTDITPLDFTSEAKLRDTIKEVLKFGSDSTPPRQMFFQLWSYRMPWLVEEPELLLENVTYKIPVSFDYSQKALTSSFSREKLYNKIHVYYDDPDIGPDFITPEEDSDSQARWGVREGHINAGQVGPNQAALVGEIAIASYKDPTQTSSLQVGAFNTFENQPSKPFYYIRAGDVISLNGVDPYVTEILGEEGIGKKAGLAVVQSTSYNIGSGVLSIVPGLKDNTFDLLMTRMGLGSGSVQ